MKNLLDNNNRTVALITILILAVGSISIVVTTHVATANQIGKVCVFFACGNANITAGGTQSSGGGGGGQPTPTTATLIVTKAVVGCAVPEICGPSTFTIKITGVTASPNSFPGDAAGTHVTVSPGKYTVSETPRVGIEILFSGDCDVDSGGTTASGNINAGETKTCEITNRLLS